MRAMKQLLAWVAPFSFILAGFVPPPTAYGTDRFVEEGPARFTGVYAHTECERDQGALDAAIERVIGQLGFLVRDIARERVRAALRPERRIALFTVGEERCECAWMRGLRPPCDSRGRRARCVDPMERTPA